MLLLLARPLKNAVTFCAFERLQLGRDYSSYKQTLLNQWLIYRGIIVHMVYTKCCWLFLTFRWCVFYLHLYTKFTDPSGRAVYGRSLAAIVGSNLTGGMDICLLWVLCFVRCRSLRRADHSSRFLPNVVCLSVIVKPR